MNPIESKITQKLKKFDSSRRKTLFIVIVDILLIIFCYVLAFFLRFELTLPFRYFMVMLKTLPLILLMRILFFKIFGLYKGMWRFASTEDLIAILKAVTTSSVLIVLSLYFVNQFQGYPRSIFIIDWMLLVISIGGFRFSIRFSKEIFSSSPKVGKRTLIVGAGSAGEAILREMLKGKNGSYNPIGLIDDDPRKKGLKVHGVKVMGNREDIPDIVNYYNIEEIIISIPSASRDQIRDIVDYCIESGARFKTIPALSEIMDGRVSVSQIREVRMEDLLGRDPVETDLKRIKHEFSGKRVLVTGGGGSIGRELCRQIARFEPEKLLLFDHGENSVFYTHRETQKNFPSLDCIPLVADVCDRKTTERIFKQYRPQIIFHAAAHKHVPLMEVNALEAFRNNVLGTKNVADLAIKNKVEKFVFISTDKAVKPHNLMGATKRLGELYIASLAKANSTKFMSVRFGNVIGSTGSVARLFKEQIEQGGPLTVTHEEASRFLMTIPEAVQLILQSASMGQGGEIFVLDMGEPIKILNLAKTMIRLSGLEPDKDIPIKVTGLRAGEKLHEELYNEEIEDMKKTSHKKILMVKDLNNFDPHSVIDTITDLENTIKLMDEKSLMSTYKKLVQSGFTST